MRRFLQIGLVGFVVVVAIAWISLILLAGAAVRVGERLASRR